MTDSNITVSGLTATPAVRGLKLAWAVSDPNTNGLPYLKLKIVEVWASTTNDRTTASKVAEGNTEAPFEGAIEETTYYFWIKAKNASDLYGDWYPSGSTSGIAGTAIGMSGLAFGLANAKLVATVSANALTIAVKTAVGGGDPSASDQVYVAFRNATLTSGNYQIRAITAALSLVISSGSTLGASNSTPFRVWVLIIDDGGTLRLAAAICTTSTVTVTLDESRLLSTTAEGGSGAADTPGVFYTGTAATSKPYRIIGFLDFNSGLATAGTWAAGPDVIQMFGPGVKKPGELVQSTTSQTSSSTLGATLIPSDDTIPQNTEGDQYFSTSFTPSAAVNWIEHDIQLYAAADVASALAVALFKDSAANAIAAAFVATAGTPQEPTSLPMRFRQVAGQATSITFKVRAGMDNAAKKFVLNGVYSASGGGTAVRFLGGVMFSAHRMTEITA